MPPDPVPICLRHAARLRDDYLALTSGQDTECGYAGLPVREDAWKLHIPMFLRFAMGGCEEYNNVTTTTIPREPPNPFVDTPGAAFCASGTSLANRVQAWLGVVGIAMLISYLIWLKWFIQERARLKDKTRLTAADYAIMLSGLKRDEEIDGADGLRNQLSADLEDLGFAPAQIDHIAFGSRGRKQIQLLRQLGVMKDNEEALNKKGDSDGLAEALEKRKEVVEKFELELEQSELSMRSTMTTCRASRSTTLTSMPFPDCGPSTSSWTSSRTDARRGSGPRHQW